MLCLVPHLFRWTMSNPATHKGYLDQEGRFLVVPGYEWQEDQLHRLGHLDCRIAWDRKDGWYCIARRTTEAHTLKSEEFSYLTHFAEVWTNVASFFSRSGLRVEPNIMDWHLAYSKDPERFQVNNTAWVNREMRKREKWCSDERRKEHVNHWATLPERLASFDKDFESVRTSVAVP